ncbi:unnamed protein product, partial [Prorocentrum cordatum]
MTGIASKKVEVPAVDAMPRDRQSFLKTLLTRNGGTIVDKESVFHYATCVDSQCARCKFVVHADIWKTELPLGDAGPLAATTWLQWRDYGAGCVACNAAGLIGHMATFSVNTTAALQLCHLKRHQSSDAHNQAASAYNENSAELLAGAGAPSAEAFETLLRELPKGVSPTAGMHGVGQKHKISKMIWCLREAISDIDRDFLARSMCTTLFRDERHGRLALRFSAIDADLNVRHGRLGQRKHFGTGALAITNATRNVMIRAMTAGYNNLVATVRMVAVDCASDEINSVRCCAEFLFKIDTRTCVMLALMADASDDALSFTRGVDSWENFDPSALNADVYCFLIRIVELYMEGRVCTILSYTKYMLDCLRQFPIVVPSGTDSSDYKTIGDRNGVPQAIIQSCLHSLSRWVKLCVHVMRAEFPDFELIQRFSVFNLDADAASRRGGREHEAARRRDIAVLANAMGVGEADLRNELDALAPVARQRRTQTGANTLDSWIAAIRRAESRKSMSSAHPAHTIREGIYRLAMFRACTSKVEQDFSKIDEVLGSKRLNGVGSTEDDVIKVVLDTPEDPEELSDVIVRARVIWRECLGVSRPGDGRGRRFDFGVLAKRKLGGSVGQTHCKFAGKDFVHARRQAAIEVAESVEVADALDKIDAAGSAVLPGWTTKHDKELAFQMAKRDHRLREAVHAGHVFNPDADLVEEAAAQTAEEKKRSVAAARKAARQREQLRPGDLGDLQGQAVFFLHQSEACDRQAAALRMRVLPAMIAGDAVARVVVAADVSQIPEFVEVCVRILGGSLVTPEVFQGLRKGPCLTFFAAASLVNREIWISARFRAAKPDIARLLDKAAQSDQSKWAIIASVAEFEAARHAAKMKSGVLGLATAVEVSAIKTAMPAHAKHVFELPAFLAYNSKLDRGR